MTFLSAVIKREGHSTVLLYLVHCYDKIRMLFMKRKF